MNKNEKPRIFDIIYEDLEKDIKDLKEKCSAKFKYEFEKIGFKFVSEWIDYSLPILYTDKYLVEYCNFLFVITFSAGTKQIHIGTQTFTKVHTIDKNRILNGYKNKTVNGYSIDKDNRIIKNKNYPLKNFIQKDLLRINKIAKLLDE